MKLTRVCQKVGVNVGLVSVLLTAMFAFACFVRHQRQREDSDWYDLRRFLFFSLNTNTYATWLSPAHARFGLFKAPLGNAELRLVGDAQKYIDTQFAEGLDALKISLHEKYKIATTTAEFTLEGPRFDPDTSSLVVANQTVDVFFLHSNSNSFSKKCQIEASFQMLHLPGKQGMRLDGTVTSPTCPALTLSLKTHVSENAVKTYQVVFHVLICYFLLCFQTYFLAKLDATITAHPTFAKQLSLVSVLVLGTFQLFNGFEQLVLSAFSFPLWGFIVLIGLGFLNLFFFTIVKLLANIVRTELQARMLDDAPFNLRGHLLLTYLLSHTTILMTFTFCVSHSHTHRLFLYWTLALVPQLLKNFVAEVRCLRPLKHLSGLYLTTILYAVYQHFYSYNFYWVKNEAGFEEGNALRVLVQALALVLVVAVQEILNPQKFLSMGLHGPSYDYFRTIEQLRETQGEQLAEVECIICMSGICQSEDTLSALALPDDDLGDFIRQNAAKPVMVCPCGHMYHSGCLVTWMEKKMECPMCRGKLPALI